MVEHNLTVIPLDDYDPSFEEMKKDHEAGNGYVFAGGSCDDTVFHGNRRAQYLYRVWHDCLHVKYNLGFGKDDELELAKLIRVELENQSLHHDGKLLCDDLTLHIHYFYNHNKHPMRQLEMIKAYRRGGFAAGAIPGIF